MQSKHLAKHDSSQDLAVAINTFKESERQLRECLQRVHDNLPSASVHIFINGGLAEHQKTAAEFDFVSSVVPNYGNNRLWYLWWKRMIEWFLTTNATKLLKIDPDTMVDTVPKAIPDADYFGCIDDWFVQGGVTGLSRTLAMRLIDEKMLCRSQAMRCNVSKRAFADDKYLAKLLTFMNVRATPWDEVYSRWKLPVANSPLTHSIVHPRYFD